MYYDSIYSKKNNSINKQLFDVNKQISSGLNIQYASDDISIYTETMRLDNEMTTLGQIKKSTSSGYKVANQTDVVLNEFETNMNRVRTLLIQASNGSNSELSLDAIASELRGLEDHFRNLANTSINGQYLFAGSSVNIKPIDNNGIYHGNGTAMSSFLGSGVQQQYNLTGADLFLGEEILVKKQVTTNIIQNNLSAMYPDFTNSDVPGTTKVLTEKDTIRDMMGDTDNIIDVGNKKHFFYVRGVQSDGTSFNKKIAMSDDEKISELLKQIGQAYGNTPNLDVVNVKFNKAGQIVIEDKITGSSKLDFHIVGAVDFSGGNAADVTNIDALDGAETDFKEIIKPTTPPAKDLFVKEFIRSGYTSADGAASNIDALVYNRVQFEKDGSKLSSNIAQVVRGTNVFASGSTKLSDVADISQGTSGTLDGTQFTFSGQNVSGTAFNAQIDLKSSANGGSTFSLDGGVTNFDIFTATDPRTAVDADNMTYQQFMDVINMVMTNNVPLSNNTTDYDSSVYSSKFSGNTYLSYDGKIQFEEMNTTNTQAKMSLFDSNSGDFSKNPSVLSFNANNAITVRDPKTDFFKMLDEMIKSVEDHKVYADNTSGHVRNVGMENAIQIMDDLQTHVSRSHALIGAQANVLNVSLERTSLLEISTQTLRSSVIDTDLAEASLNLQQVTTTYQAMLATISKVSQLSLVNYIK
jgi:flagellar hook-associated protein 3 FlgL